LCTSESLTNAEILNTSTILNQPEQASADEATTNEEENAVVEPLISGAQAKNYINEL